MKKCIFAPVVAAVIISATAALGAEQKGQFSISPVAGGYTYEGKQRLKTAPLFGGRLGYNITENLGIEAVFDYVRTKGTNSTENATMYRAGADLIFNLFPDKALVPFLAFGASGISFTGTGLDNNLHAAWGYGGGVKYYLTDAVALRGDLRHIIYNQSSTTLNNLEYTLGVHIPFGGGTPVSKPVEAISLNPVPASAPTPAPVAAAVSPQVTPTPTVAVPPPAPMTRTVLPVLSSSVDSDHDGINDSLDRCPNTPPGTAVDAYGCPLSAKQAETKKRFCDKPAVLTVSFDSGRTEIKPEFRDELARVAYFLKEFPESKGAIEGHTDNVGNSVANRNLSQRRAANVRAYLITNFGISPDRITAKGLGPDKPVESNKTAAGKAKNRRIEAVFTCK